MIKEFSVKEVEIDKIKIGKRQRKYIGDITPLKKSLKEIGLINPIIVSEDLRLIAGYRRFLAAKELGWKTIPARIIPLKYENLFEDIEFHENYSRKNLFQEEVEEVIKSKNEKSSGLIKKLIAKIFKLKQ
jgi:ParB family transcriptional regulator, chromosome partitioning protein